MFLASLTLPTAMLFVSTGKVTMTGVGVSARLAASLGRSVATNHSLVVSVVFFVVGVPLLPKPTHLAGRMGFCKRILAPRPTMFTASPLHPATMLLIVRDAIAAVATGLVVAANHAIVALVVFDAIVIPLGPKLLGRGGTALFTFELIHAWSFANKRVTTEGGSV